MPFIPLIQMDRENLKWDAIWQLQVEDGLSSKDELMEVLTFILDGTTIQKALVT